MLSSGGWGEHRYVPGEVPAELRALREGDRALEEERWADAERLFSGIVEHPRVEIRALTGLVVATSHRDAGAAAPYAQRLRSLRSQRPIAASTEALGVALHAVQRTDEAFELACGQLERTGSCGRMRAAFVTAALAPARQQRAEQALRAAIGLTNGPSKVDRAAAWRMLAILVAPRDWQETVRANLRATLLDGAADDLLVVLRMNEHRVAPGTLERLIEEVGASPDERVRLLSLASAETEDREGSGTTLASNLRAIVECCRQAGAEAVLLDYPVAAATFDAARGEVCDELGVARIDVLAAFERAMLTASVDDLFAARGGHCNDAGYALIAELVAADARQRLAR